jgi:hypothetical protein
MPAYLMSDNFILKYGENNLKKFIELCNQLPQLPLDEIGKPFKLGGSQVCRLRSGLLIPYWGLKEGTKQRLQHAEHVHTEAIKEMENFIQCTQGKKVELELIVGEIRPRQSLNRS